MVTLSNSMWGSCWLIDRSLTRLSGLPLPPHVWQDPLIDADVPFPQKGVSVAVHNVTFRFHFRLLQTSTLMAVDGIDGDFFFLIRAGKFFKPSPCHCNRCIWLMEVLTTTRFWFRAGKFCKALPHRCILIAFDRSLLGQTSGPGKGSTLFGLVFRAREIVILVCL